MARGFSFTIRKHRPWRLYVRSWVDDDGNAQELPTGDTASGAVSSAIGEVVRVLTADYTMPATSSLSVIDYLDDGGFTLEIPADGVVEVTL